MKKILLLLSMIMFVAIGIQAQTTNTKVGNPEAYMTPEQLAKYKSDMEIANLEKKLETYGKWVGVGGEVGTAVKEGLTAVVDVANQFGDTDVGKFTIIMVAWKVMGEDVIRILIGFIWIILITYLFIRVYKNTYQAKRYVIKREPNGFWKRATKEYEVVEPDDNWEGYVLVKIVMLFLYAGAIGIACGIIFGGA